MEAIQEKKLRKPRQGVVVSKKMDKTVVVFIEGRKMHPLYRKTMPFSQRFLVHDEKNECNEGDLIRFVPCRPLSKHKTHRLVSIVERGEIVERAELEASVHDAIHVKKHIPEEQLRQKEEKEAGESGTASADSTEATDAQE